MLPKQKTKIVSIQGVTFTDEKDKKEEINQEPFLVPKSDSSLDIHRLTKFPLPWVFLLLTCIQVYFL